MAITETQAALNLLHHPASQGKVARDSPAWSSASFCRTSQGKSPNSKRVLYGGGRRNERDTARGAGRLVVAYSFLEVRVGGCFADFLFQRDFLEGVLRNNFFDLGTD